MQWLRTFHERCWALPPWPLHELCCPRRYTHAAGSEARGGGAPRQPYSPSTVGLSVTREGTQVALDVHSEDRPLMQAQLQLQGIEGGPSVTVTWPALLVIK